MSEPRSHPAEPDDPRTPTGATSLLREALLADGSALGRTWVAAEMFEYEGELNLTALQHAVDALVARHQGLRDTFHRGPGGWTQHSRSPRPSAVLPSTGEPHLCDVPFDMGTGPFLRVVHESGDRRRLPRLCLEAAHFVADGVSLSVLFEDLEKLYTAFALGRPAPLPAAPQPEEFARRQRAELTPARREQICADWESRLRGAVVPVFDRPRTDDAAPETAVLCRALQPDLLRSLRSAAAQHRTTLPILAFHCYARALATTTAQPEVVFDTPFSGRAGGFGQLVDNVANVMPLRLRADLPLGESLSAILDQVLAATDAELLPFHEVEQALSDRLDPGTDLSQMTFFSVWEHSTLRLPGLRFTPVAHSAQEGALALQACSTFVQIDGDAGEVLAVYDRNCADHATAERLLDVFFDTALEIGREPETAGTTDHGVLGSLTPSTSRRGGVRETFAVLENRERHLSLWPVRLSPPTGWAARFEGDRATCLRHVEAVWRDRLTSPSRADAAPGANGAGHGGS